ncbi:MAG: hypothetical protein ABJN52_00210 [Litorimonas sp.]
MKNSIISEDERPLGQLFWFLMFLGWTPMLAAYGHVLDPVTSARNGILVTFADTVTLYPQTGWYGPFLGVLTVAGLVTLWLLFRLRWYALWPIPAFLLWSCLIHVFNAPGLGTSLEMTVHLVYALLAVACSYLFLRHGHLLSVGFLGYITLLVIDGVLHHMTLLPAGLLGKLFDAYTPSLIAAAQFLAIAVLLRMLWLMVRDNRAFFGRLDRKVRRQASLRTLRFWWPMAAVYIAFSLFWWGLLNLIVQPAVITEFDRARTELERSMGPLLAANLEIDPNLITEAEVNDFMKRDGFTRLFAMVELAQTRLAANDWVGAQLRDHRERSHAFYADWKAENPNGEEALERSVRRWSQLQIGVSDIRIQFGVIMAGYETLKGGNFVDHADRQIRAAFPRSTLPTLSVPSCWFWQIGCIVEATIARRVNRLMTRLHEQLIGAVTGQIETLYAQAEGNAERAVQSIRDFSAELHRDTSRETTEAIRNTFRIWRGISLLALIYGLIILLKTLLIVFSRVIFSPKSGIGATAQFLPHEPPATRSEIARHGTLFSIPTSAPEAHFVSRWGVTLEGPPPARRRPMGFKFPVARILSGTWAMNRIEGNRAEEEDEFDADLKVDEPAELVVWHLAEGERVIFRFSDFVGMSEDVQVRRISSLSITTLVLGRMIYHAAEGPGTLILRTTAAARISSEVEGTRPAPMPKLVAWGAETSFGVLAALTTVDTFLSGYNLKVGHGARVVWDTSTKRGDGPGTGIFRFVKSFLLPI